MTPGTLKMVHIASGDLWAGAEVQLYYLARALHAHRDVQLHVILLNHGELERRLEEAGVRVEVIDERELGVMGLLIALRARLEALRPHLIHSHRYKENLLAALAARGKNCLAVRTVHSATPIARSLRQRAVRVADIASARLQHAAVCVSPELVADVQVEYPRLPVEVIENGIDFEQLHAAAGAPIDESVLGDGFRVAFIGRMVPVKRPDLFITAAHHLTEEFPGRFSFHLFGDGPLLTECEEFISRHGLDAQVRLLGFRADMPAWLARMDALILCSDHEGMPMVLLEAMALGVPVIAHAVGGMPHTLGFGEFGLLVRDHTLGAYADALLSIADDPAATQARARRAANHVERQFAIASIAERYVAFYRQLLHTPGGQCRFVGE